MTMEGPLQVPHGLCLTWHTPSPGTPPFPGCSSTWFSGIPSGPSMADLFWGCSALSNLLSFLTTRTSALGGTTMPLAVTDESRAGHRTQARPIRLGFSRRASGLFMLVGLMELDRCPRLGVKGQEGARQEWKES